MALATKEELLTRILQRVFPFFVLGLACAGPPRSSAPVHTPKPSAESSASPGRLRSTSDKALFETAPELVSMAAPKYPNQAVRERVEGVVLIRALVSAEGTVKEMLVIESVHPLLDEAALEAVKDSTWIPATMDGKPVAVWVLVPLEFTLND